MTLHLIDALKKKKKSLRAISAPVIRLQRVQQSQAGVRSLNLNDSGSARHSKLVVLFWSSLGMRVKWPCDAAFAPAVSLLINYNTRKNAEDPGGEVRRVIARQPSVGGFCVSVVATGRVRLQVPQSWRIKAQSLPSI